MHRLVRRSSLWLRRHRRAVRYAEYVSGGFLVAVVAIQLLYPAGRTMPFVKVQDAAVGGKSTAQLSAYLDQRYSKATLVLKTQDKTFTQPLQEVGIDVDSWKTAREATHYSLGQRLIPFSSVAIMLTRNTATSAKYDNDRLDYFAQQVQKQGFVSAVNASIAVKGSKVALVPAKPSKEYPAKDVTTLLESTHFSPKTTVAIKPHTKAAERTDSEVKGVLSEAQKAVDTPLTLKLDDEKISVNKTTIGGWLDFTEDAKTKQLQLGLKPDVVAAYLQSIQSKVYKAPGTTHVQVIDGREAGRTPGETGRGIDVAKTTATLTDVLKKAEKTTVNVPIAELPAKIVYDKQYSNGDAGLTALVNDLASSKGGYGISVMEIGGRSANVNGNKQFEAASTYKLYVAYAIFQRINAGQMQWTDNIVDSRNAEKCFDDMIVKSDNTCAKAFAQKIGWQAVEDMAHGLGFTSTDLTGSTLLTTANDLSLYLYKLQNGSLLNSSDTDRLIGAMKRQIYRSGIPAGTGLPVADKVGFVDNVIHDAGIVYGPKGPYVLVIMTSNSSWSGIADAARQINAFLAK